MSSLAKAVNTEPSPVILTGPENWRPWLAVVRKFAIDKQIWDIVNPELNEQSRVKLTAPQPPVPLHFLSQSEQQRYHDDLELYERDPTAERPETPTFGSITNKERKADFKYALDLYNVADRKYEAKLQALSQLRSWINTHINEKCRTYIQDSDTVADEIRELHKRMAPTDYAEGLAVTKDYRQVQLISRSTKIEDWLDQWEKTLRDAQRLNLPDVAGDRPVRDFLEAIRSHNPLFYQSWSNALDMALLTNKPIEIDGFSIAQIFRSQVRQLRSVKDVSRATFAIFQGREPPPENSNQGSQDGNKDNKKTPSKCICGKEHWYSRCPYIVEAVRQKGWNPDPVIEAKVKEAEQNPKIKTKFEKARERQGSKDAPKEANLPSSAFASFATISDPYQHPLRNSVIYDSGSDNHLGNDISRFDQGSIRWLSTPDYIMAGDSHLPIHAYGDLIINITTATGTTRPFTLRNAAYVPDFHVSVASARLFKRAKIYWDMKRDALTYDNQVLMKLTEIHGQFVLEYNEPKATFTATKATEATATQSAGTPAPKQRKTEDPKIWHLRMGHLGKEALERLVQATTGVAIEAPTTIDCEDCSRAKAKNVISADPIPRSPRPFYRVHFDLFEHNESYNGKSFALIFKEEHTGVLIPYFLRDKSQASIM
ncbi:hypothetical protein QBC46DRAFT_326417, partial [Diplogelasinospora grovesii]